MEASLLTNTVIVAAKQGVSSFNSLLHRHKLASNNTVKATDDQSTGVVQISAAILDAIAPPPAKPTRRTLRRRKRRVARRSLSGGDSSDSGEDYDYDYAFFGGGGGGDYEGPFGGGGKGWNFGGFEGQNWEDSFSSGRLNFSYGFVYEVVFWIALSNCLHFAFNKVVKFVSDGEREKVTMRLAC